MVSELGGQPMLQDPALKQQQQKAQKDFQQKLTARFVPSRPYSYLSANRFLPKIPIPEWHLCEYQ